MFLYVISFSYVFVANREFTISSFWGHPGCEVAQMAGAMPGALLSGPASGQWPAIQRPAIQWAVGFWIL